MLIVLLVSSVNAISCHENIKFYSTTDQTSCGDVIILKVIYENSRCSDKGVCWDDYRNVTLNLPKNIYSYDRLTKYLDKWEFDAGSWSVRCNSLGIYNFSVVLQNTTSSCTKTLTLNLTELQEQKKVRTQANEDLEEQSISETSSADSYDEGSSTNNEVAQTPKPSRSDVVVLAKNQDGSVNNEKSKESSKIYLFVGMILVFFVVVVLIVFFFIRKRRKKMNPSIIQYKFED